MRYNLIEKVIKNKYLRRSHRSIDSQQHADHRQAATTRAKKNKASEHNTQKVHTIIKAAGEIRNSSLFATVNFRKNFNNLKISRSDEPTATKTIQLDKKNFSESNGALRGKVLYEFTFLHPVGAGRAAESFQRSVGSRVCFCYATHCGAAPPGGARAQWRSGGHAHCRATVGRARAARYHGRLLANLFTPRHSH